MFEIIDENIRLASCSISDLTDLEMMCVLDNWKSGVPIGTLTLFYNRCRRMIVLNRDNKDYEVYKEAVLAYMQLDPDERKDAVGKLESESVKETLQVVESAMEQMETAKEISIIKKNGLDRVSDREFKVINAITENFGINSYAHILVFCYGVICGKREERARRKRGLSRC